MAVSEVEIMNILVRLSGDMDDFKEMLDESQKLAEGFAKGIGKKVRKAGAFMTAGVTAPIAAAAGASVAMAEDINKAMANVQSLGLDTDRVMELKSGVQDLAVEMGSTTDDIAGGLYQVVSAFGDTSDSMDLLAISAQAGKAGLASTEEAINLVSAVTKGYGDTSKEAAQKAADLAFQTVKLGQTTFPELASSMGRVVPIASLVGASQEELFAQFATLTGVTGGAAEVSTQLAATYKALMGPTSDMGKAIGIVATKLEESGDLVENKFTDRWRALQVELAKTSEQFEAARKAGNDKEVKRLGERYKGLVESLDAATMSMGLSIVESTSAAEAINLLTDAAEGDSNVLKKMWGSADALKAVLTLTGAQSEVFAEKLGAMEGATGAANDAFIAQTEGLSKLSHQAAQARAQMQVIGQEMGDRLAPITLSLQTKILGLVKWFGSLSEGTQEWIMIAAGLAATLGPILLMFGQMLIVLPKVIALIKLLAASALALKLAVVGLALGGIAIVATYIYRWRANLADMNRELERSKALNDELMDRRAREQSDVLSAANSLTGADKQEFVQAQLAIAERELAGSKAGLAGSRTVLDEARERGDGSKVIESMERDVAEAEAAVANRRRFRDQLDDIINGESRKQQLVQDTLGRDPDAKQNADNLTKIADTLESIEDKSEDQTQVLVQDEVQ